MELAIIILICCFPLLGFVWIEFEERRQRRRQHLDSVIKDLLTFGLRNGFITHSEAYQLEKMILGNNHSIPNLERFHRVLLDAILEDVVKKAKREEWTRQKKEKPSDDRHPVQKILGLGKDFTQDELKKSYRKWMMTNHPDKNPNADTDLVQQVTAWYNQRKVK